MSSTPRIPSDSETARRALSGIPLVLLPSVSLLMGLPLVWGVWSEVVTGRVGPTTMHPLLWGFSTVILAAFLAVPGYFVTAFEPDRLPALSSPGRWWIRISLTAGAIAAVVATPLTFFFGRWLWLFPVGTLACCTALLARAERCWRSRRAALRDPDGHR